MVIREEDLLLLGGPPILAWVLYQELKFFGFMQFGEKPIKIKILAS